MITYFFLDIFKGTGAYYTEAYKENIRLWITKWSQPVIVFLTCEPDNQNINKLLLKATKYH